MWAYRNPTTYNDVESYFEKQIVSGIATRPSELFDARILNMIHKAGQENNRHTQVRVP